MAIITLGLAVVPSGNLQLLDQVPAKLDKMDASAKKAGIGMAGMADGIGRVSTTLARSVGVLGLSSDSLRALDDAADIAELGLKGVAGGLGTVVTKASLFSAATLGMVGAALAAGAALGTWLRTFPAIAAAADHLGRAVHDLFTGFDRAATAGPDQKTFQMAMGAKQAEGLKKQIEALRAMGRSIDDIAKTSGDALKRMLDPLAEGDKIAKLKELGFSVADITKLIPALTDNLKGETDAQRAAALASKQHAEELKKLAEAAFQFLEKQALSASMEQEEAAMKKVEEAAKRLEEEFKDLEEAALDAAKAAEEWELDQELDEAAKQADLLRQELEATALEAKRMSEVRLDAFLEGAVNLVNLFGEAWRRVGEIVANTVNQISQAKTPFEKFTAIARGVGQIGGMVGGKVGGALSGAASGAMMGAAVGSIIPGIGTVVGGVIGGVVGALGGILGSAKKKAEELKKQQAAAIDAFVGLYQEWTRLRSEIALAGAEGVNKLVGAMFKDGKLDESLTSAANAADYVFASFSALRLSGMSAAEALAALGPALEAMLKDPAKFKGTAAEPLLQMARFVKANQALIDFQAGLGDTAIALATFNLLTQDLANKISADLSGSIDKMIEGGLSREQALALSADSLFKLQQAAEKSGVTLDSHTQKMIDDAKAAGLFEGLQDPMERLVEIQNAMLVVSAQLVTLLGGAVPAAVQKMIDEFNSAQINVGGASGSTSGGEIGGAEEGGGGGGRGGYQHGSDGVINFGAGKRRTLHGEEAVFTKADIMDLIAAAAQGGNGGGDYRLYLDGREVAKNTARHNRKNHGGTLSQQRRGRR